MKLNHDNISTSSPAAETGTAIGGWQVTKVAFLGGLGWEAGKATVGLVTGGIAAVGAGAAGLGAAALAGCFGGKEEKKEEPKK